MACDQQFPLGEHLACHSQFWQVSHLLAASQKEAVLRPEDLVDNAVAEITSPTYPGERSMARLIPVFARNAPASVRLCSGLQRRP